MVGITTATTAKSDQELCKAEYVHMLQSVPARTTAPHCAAMTDAQWLDIKRGNKARLAKYLRTATGIELNPDYVRLAQARLGIEPKVLPPVVEPPPATETEAA